MTSLDLVDHDPAELAACAIRAMPGADAREFLGLFEMALELEPLPSSTATYRARYRAVAAQEGWGVVSLVKHAERAGLVARRLWTLAAGCGDDDRTRLQERAVERSTAVTDYLDVIDVFHPGAIESFRPALIQLSPGWTSTSPLPAVAPASDAEIVGALVDALLAELRGATLLSLDRSSFADGAAAGDRKDGLLRFDALLARALASIADLSHVIQRRLRRVPADQALPSLTAALRRHIRSTSEEPIDLQFQLQFGLYP
jgi:hypothetical protein